MVPLQIPFTINILENAGSPKTQDQTQHFQSLLPATSRTKSDSIVTPQATLEFLEKELLVQRLNAIQEHLWACGRPMPARPLHTQVLLKRNIVITENMELHLVWASGRIFVKPIPLYLLDPDCRRSGHVRSPDLGYSRVAPAPELPIWGSPPT